MLFKIIAALCFADCLYFGQLSNDPDSCVAVTGCLGSEDVEISIRSGIYDTSDLGYVWHKEGHISEAGSNKVNSTLSSFQRVIQWVINSYFTRI